MRRTTVYLPEALKAALERTAQARRTSEAAVIRGAIEVATAEHARPLPRLPLFESGDETLAERVDAELSGFGEP